MHVDVCASLRRLVYGVDKLGTAVGVDGVVAAVVGNEHVLKIIALGIDYTETWSCYKGGDKQCGKCGTCVERKEALRDAGIEDLTEYEI